jgi:GR25 family glycosyltransferase involved in LPS biosynthesis
LNIITRDVIAPMLTAPQTHLHDKKYSTFRPFEIYPDLLNRIDHPIVQKRFDAVKSNYESYLDRKFKGSLLVKAVKDCFLFKIDQTILKKLFKMNKQTLKGQDADEAICEQLIKEQVPMHLFNGKELGYVIDKEISDRKDSFAVLRMEHLLKGSDGTFNEPLPITEFLEESSRKKRKTKLGFNEIYVINLKRRPDRKNRSVAALNELNLSHKLVEAVDGKTMKEDILKELGIRLMPSYRDPHSGRFMNYGEIGCFLSHYNIWKEAVENNYEKIIILEDDARFEMNFKSTFKGVMNQISAKGIEWDLIYLGRKIMRSNEESWNYEVDFKKGFGLRNPSFSHWTIAYALSLSGAKKLINSEPLLNMIPIDEYLPLMYNKPSK